MPWHVRGTAHSALDEIVHKTDTHAHNSDNRSATGEFPAGAVSEADEAASPFPHDCADRRRVTRPSEGTRMFSVQGSFAVNPTIDVT